jgi:transposase
MSPEEIAALIAENSALKEQNRILREEQADLKEQLSWLKRQIFGTKSERFVPAHESQMSLELGSVATTPPSVQTQHITYERTKPAKHTPHGREEIPAHLRREETVIMPDSDVSGMARIGEKVTEQLHYSSPQYWVKKIVRPVFAADVNGERVVVCAELPLLCNEKGKYGASMIAHVTVSKFEDHTPIYRLQKQIQRDSGMKIAETSLDRLPELSAFWLEPIARRCSEIVNKSGYVQMDESTIRVMIQPTQGKSTTGYMWLRHSPPCHIVVFDYDRHHSGEAARRFIGDYQGILQTDGYVVYDAYSKKNGVIHAGCHAHARRGFDESIQNDKQRATHALEIYRTLFDIEAEAKKQGLLPDQRLYLRKEKSAPIVEAFKQWLDVQVLEVRPKNAIGKAILYCLGNWRQLTRFLEDGRIELSTNFVENCVRPLALGRKNWLFAGSEDSARRMAILYTVLQTCRLNGVNSLEYLSSVLEELPRRKAGDIEDLLPTNWLPVR